jgi:tetratricopeptide (TPR) repeat protein
LYLCGELNQPLLADTLGFLSRERASGVLTCQQDGRLKQVTLCRGQAVAVLSNGLDERLGSSMVRRGVLTEAEVRLAVEAQSRTDGRFGEVLVALGVLDPLSLAEELQCQALFALGELMGWSKGTLLFEPKALDLPAHHPVWLDLGPVVLQGLLDHGSPLEQRVALEARIELAPQGRQADELGDEAGALLQDAPGRSVREVLDASARGRERTLRLLLGLDALELLQAPLLEDAEPGHEELLGFYRSLLQGIFVALDTSRGAPGAGAFFAGWRAAGGVAGLEIGEDGRLQVRGADELGPLGATAGALRAAAGHVLHAVQSHFGLPAAEEIVRDLEPSVRLLLRRQPALERLVAPAWAQLRSVSPPETPARPKDDENTERLLLEEARSRLESLDYEAALGLYRLVLALAPADAEAREGEAAALRLHQGRQVEAIVQRARRDEAQGKLALALGELEKALGLEPEREDLIEQQQRLQHRLVRRVHELFGGPECRPRLRVPLEELRDVELGADEGFLLAQVDGRTDLHTLVVVGGMGTTRTYRLMLSMLERGLLEVPRTRSGA